MTDIEDILSRVSCPDLCEELGIELDGRGRTPCFHDGLDAHTNRSVDVDERLFYCHRCGKGGTVIDLLMQATGCSFRKAILQLEDFAENKPAKVERAEPKMACVFSHEDLRDFNIITPAHDDFRRKRYGSINWDPTHNVYPVRSGFAFCYPNPTGEGWEGVKFRFFDGGKSSIPGSKFTHLWRARAGSGTAVLCEGETDALALACYIYSNPYEGGNCAVYSLPSGAGKWDVAWQRELDPFSKVYVCMDNDPAGMAAADKIVRASAWRWDKLRVPGLYNDAEEALKNGWDPKLV